MVFLDFGLPNGGDNHHRDRNDESNLMVALERRLAAAGVALGG